MRACGLAIALAACSDEHSARGTLAHAFSAVAAGRADDEIRAMVSPDLLERLLDCPPDGGSRWLTPDVRRGVLEQVREHAGIDVGQQHRIVEMHREDVRALAVGDDLRGCTVKAPFAVETYEVTYEISDATGRYPMPPRERQIWHVGDDWLLFDDPLG